MEQTTTPTTPRPSKKAKVVGKTKPFTVSLIRKRVKNTETLNAPTLRTIRLISNTMSNVSHEFAKPTGVERDLWDDDENVKVEIGQLPKSVIKAATRNVDYEYLDKAAQGRTKNKRSKLSEGYSKRGPMTVAPAGLSINPHPEAYQEVLDIAELRAEADARRQQAISDRAAGRFEIPVVTIDEKDVEATAHWYEPLDVLPSTTFKSIPQRNKERRQKILLGQAALRRKEKNIHKSIEKAPEYIAEIEKSQKITEERMVQNVKRKEFKAKYEVTQTGKNRFVAPFPEVRLEEELSAVGSLRETLPSSSLVNDSFSRLQQQGLVQITKYRPLSRRYALKYTAPNSTKRYTAPDVSELIAQAELEAERNPKQFTKSKNTKNSSTKSGKDDKLQIWE